MPHGSGEHVPPLLHVPEQAACVVSEQVPSAAQQEPVGGAQIFGVQPPPLNHVPEQAACVVSEQVPSAAQQEPVGGGVATHGLGVQDPPIPQMPAAQSAAVVWAHVPSNGPGIGQHEPVAGGGCAHGLGVQEPPCVQVMAMRLPQSAKTVSVQAPVALAQHAPAQMFGVQEPPCVHVPESWKHTYSYTEGEQANP